jgi:hypothetical protein
LQTLLKARPAPRSLAVGSIMVEQVLVGQREVVSAGHEEQIIMESKQNAIFLLSRVAASRS